MDGNDLYARETRLTAAIARVYYHAQHSPADAPAFIDGLWAAADSAEPTLDRVLRLTPSEDATQGLVIMSAGLMAALDDRSRLLVELLFRYEKGEELRYNEEYGPDTWVLLCAIVDHVPLERAHERQQPVPEGRSRYTRPTRLTFRLGLTPDPAGGASS